MYCSIGPILSFVTDVSDVGEWSKSNIFDAVYWLHPKPHPSNMPYPWTSLSI